MPWHESVMQTIFFAICEKIGRSILENVLFSLFSNFGFSKLSLDHVLCLEGNLKLFFVWEYTKTGKSILGPAFDQSNCKKAGPALILIERLLIIMVIMVDGYGGSWAPTRQNCLMGVNCIYCIMVYFSNNLFSVICVLVKGIGGAVGRIPATGGVPFHALLRVQPKAHNPNLKLLCWDGSHAATDLIPVTALLD